MRFLCLWYYNTTDGRNFNPKWRLFHPSPHRLQIPSFSDMSQERMIRGGTGEAEDLQGTARLPGGAAEGFEKVVFANQTRAGTGEEQPAGSDGLQGEFVHVEVFLEGPGHVFTFAGLLGRIENHDVELLAVGKALAQPGEKVRLDEANAPALIEVGVLFRQLQSLLIEIDADHFLGMAFRLGVDGKAARVAAQVQHALAGAELGEQPAVFPLVD